MKKLLFTLIFLSVFISVSYAGSVRYQMLDKYKGYTILGTFTVKKFIKENDGFSTKHKLILTNNFKDIALNSDDISLGIALITPGLTDVLLLAKKMSFKDKKGKIINYLNIVAIIENATIEVDPIFIK